jgi:peptidyl-prolyl cis-trans isomerase B (cyclophilin B)
MTSLKDRQRAAARARLEREMAERAKTAHKRRQLGAVIGAVVAVVVVIGIVVWIVAANSGKKPAPTAAGSSTPAASAAPVSCQWVPNPDPSASPAPAANPNLKNVGTPPTTGIATSGTQDLIVKTNLGQITIRMDLAKAPCTSASFAYLAGKKFFDGTSCHRLLNTGDSHVLQCGDPSGTGQGGPSYNFADENLPTDQRPTYVAGQVAMANTGTPGSNGSQFFIVFDDTDLPAQYTVFGKVTEGLDIAKQVAKAGDDNAFAKNPDGSQGAGGGHPKTKLTFTTVTAGPVQGASATPSAAASLVPSPTHS